VTGRSAEEVAAALRAALAPYAWREFTDRMLARRMVGAADRCVVVGLLARLPGTDVGVHAALQPVDVGDARVDALVSALDGRQWRSWSLARLCAQIASTLETWHAEQESLESELRRLLEDH
jgi:hypothetical protein